MKKVKAGKVAIRINISSKANHKVDTIKLKKRTKGIKLTKADIINHMILTYKNK